MHKSVNYHWQSKKWANNSYRINSKKKGVLHLLGKWNYLTVRKPMKIDKNGYVYVKATPLTRMLGCFLITLGAIMALLLPFTFGQQSIPTRFYLVGTLVACVWFGICLLKLQMKLTDEALVYGFIIRKHISYTKLREGASRRPPRIATLHRYEMPTEYPPLSAVTFFIDRKKVYLHPDFYEGGLPFIQALQEKTGIELPVV